MPFDPVTRVWVLSSGVGEELCGNFSSLILICLSPLFHGQFGLISCIIMSKEFASVTVIAMEMGKRYIAKAAKRKTCFIKNVDLINSN